MSIDLICIYKQKGIRGHPTIYLKKNRINLDLFSVQWFSLLINYFFYYFPHVLYVFRWMT